MAEEKDIALLADNDIIVEIEMQEAPTVAIDTTSTTTAEISGDSALGIVVGALPTLAKEATLLAKVAELKEALNNIDFSAIEKAIYNVEDVTAKETTLIQGIGDIIKAVENIDFTDLENSIAEVKNAVANIDFSALAKEETLTQVQSKVEEVGNKIDNIKLPEIDTTELAKESTLQELKKSVENVDIVVSGGVAAELTSGKRAIVEALRNRGAEVTGNETLTELAQKIVESLALLPMGTTFSNTPIDFGDALRGQITEFVSYTNGLSINSNVFVNAKAIILPNATVLPLNNSAGSKSLTSCQYLYMPKAIKYNYGYYSPLRDNSGNNLRRATLPSVVLLGKTSNELLYSVIRDSTSRLYYLDMVDTIFSTTDISVWVPTIATSTSTNLIVPMKYDDPEEPTETFVTNKDKFLWYFRKYFLPKVGDCTTLGINPTITMSSVLYNAIINETDIAEYFASRGWTVASV